jgi:hypothetical protein
MTAPAKINEPNTALLRSFQDGLGSVICIFYHLQRSVTTYE